MNPANPNLPLLESVVRMLGPLSDQFVFIGGCATGLLVTDAAAAPVRMTTDVDVIVEVLSLINYQQIERQLQGVGFKHDVRPEAPVCRWVSAAGMLDVMPVDPAILGFGNRWYPEASKTAVTETLPGGGQIKLISAPVFIATKLEAFRDRGQGDFLASHDLEDIVTVIDGRPGIVAETKMAPAAVGAYLKKSLGGLLQQRTFVQAIEGHLPGDYAGQARLPIVLERLRNIAA